MMFHSHSNKTYFQKKSCALGLILKVRVLELGSGLLQCGRKQTGQTRASLHSDEASIQLCFTRIRRRTRSVWLAWSRLLESHRPAERPTSTGLHVMIRQGSSLVQVEVPVPTKRKSRQFLPLIRWVLYMQNREEGQWVLLKHAPWFKISLTACLIAFFGLHFCIISTDMSDSL